MKWKQPLVLTLSLLLAPSALPAAPPASEGTPLDVLFGAARLAPERSPRPPGPPPPTISPLARHYRLVGTLVATDGVSYAILDPSGPGGSVQRLVRAGSPLEAPGRREPVEVRVIDRHWIGLASPGGPLERIDLDLGVTSGADRGRAGLSPPSRNSGIRRLAPDRVHIDAAARDRHLGDLPALLRSARATPVHSGGEIAAFRLSAIQPGSAFGALGLEDGDLLTTVDGRPLGDVTTLAALVGELRERKAVDLGLRRNGADLTIRYEIGP